MPVSTTPYPPGSSIAHVRAQHRRRPEPPTEAEPTKNASPGNAGHRTSDALRHERLAELVAELSDVPMATARSAVDACSPETDPLTIVAAAIVRLRSDTLDQSQVVVRPRRWIAVL